MEKAYIGNTLILSLLMFMCMINMFKLGYMEENINYMDRPEANQIKNQKTKQTNKATPLQNFLNIYRIVYVAIQMYHSIHNLYIAL